MLESKPDGSAQGFVKIYDKNFKTIFEIDIQPEQLQAFHFLDFDRHTRIVEYFYNGQILQSALEDMEGAVSGGKVRRSFYIAANSDYYFIYSPQAVVKKSEDDKL